MLKKILLIVVSLLLLASCSDNRSDMNHKKAIINIATLKGPTGLGMLKLMDENDNHKRYNIDVYTDPTLVINAFLNQEIDIATIPTNMASILYNKASGNINMLALSAFSNLYVLTDLYNVNNISDLEGKTIYAAGQGSIPQCALEYILSKNGIDCYGNTKIEYKREHTQLASLAVMSDIHIVMLPEPFVSEVIKKNPNMKIAINVNEEWNKAVNGESLLSMGCVVARKDFLENNKEQVNLFLDEYKKSIDYVNANIQAASELSEKYGIMESFIALKAIPNCNIAYVDGEDMKIKTDNFLKVLSSFDSKSIGGSIPNEDFYYKR